MSFTVIHHDDILGTMFEQIGTVIIVIVVLVVGAGLGLFAGFVLGRHKGQEMARGVKSEELEEAKTSLENARFENAELSARNAAAQAQIEGREPAIGFRQVTTCPGAAG